MCPGVSNLSRWTPVPFGTLSGWCPRQQGPGRKKGRGCSHHKEGTAPGIKTGKGQNHGAMMTVSLLRPRDPHPIAGNRKKSHTSPSQPPKAQPNSSSFPKPTGAS